MRRTALLAVLAMVLGSLFAVPATAEGEALELVQLNPGVGGFMSPNVSYVGTVPVESPGIGGRLLEVDGQQRFYMTGAKGLTILDVTDPAAPKALGRLPLPHFQNEDVDVSDDGKRVIISTDTAAVRLNPASPGAGSVSSGNGMHVIDTTDVTAPKLVGFVAVSNHTTTCADAACNWLYGSSGHIVDATDPAAPKDTGKKWFRNGVTGSHALNRDASGLMVSDSTPRLVLDVTDPLNPVALAEGRPDTRKFGKDGLLQHNNVRPNAEAWVARAEGDTSPEMRPGELLVANSESNINRNCNAAGGLSTWNMTDFDKGAPMTQVDVFRPFNGNWVDGNPAANALGCSGHWFTVDGDMVVTSWYEHGVRFFHVDPATGKITQKGFFNPVATQAGAAHWVTAADGTKYVLSADYARGLDILKFTPDAPEPTQEQFDASWMVNLGKVGSAAAAERMLCRLSQS